MEEKRVSEEFRITQLLSSVIRETLLVFSAIETKLGLITFQTYIGADWIELRYEDSNLIGLVYLSQSDYFSDRDPIIRGDKEFAGTASTLIRLIRDYDSLCEIPGYAGDEYLPD